MTHTCHNDDNNTIQENDVADETSTITITKGQRWQQQQPILSSPPMPQSDSSHVTLPTLPSQLIIEILARLPVKHLMQFRCTCKSWKSLISDPQFVKKHLALGKTTRLILSNKGTSPELLLRSYSLQSVFKSSPLIRTDHNYKFIIEGSVDALVASCDGMLCFAVNRSSIFLYNLSIEKVERLPSLINYQYNERREEIYTIYGFGHDHFSDSYKVVAVFCYRNWGRNSVVYKTDVKVHSLGTNSWRTIQDFPSGVPFRSSGKFVSGTLNWLAPGVVAFSPQVIVSLDLGQESFHELPPPDYGEIDVLSLEMGVLKNCLAILAHNRMFSDVWLMTDYGNEESWTKLFRVPYFGNFNPILYAKALCISEDEEVLLQYPTKLVVYNSRTGTFKILEIQGTNGRMFIPMVYVESLISPCSQH